MGDFILLFRRGGRVDSRGTDEEKEVDEKRWNEWFGGIAANGNLADLNLCLEPPGKVLKPNNVITGGPFVEVTERLIGFIVIVADSLEDATTIAHGCPILDVDGSVEVRPFHHVPVPGSIAMQRQKIDLTN